MGRLKDNYIAFQRNNIQGKEGKVNPSFKETVPVIRKDDHSNDDDMAFPV